MRQVRNLFDLEVLMMKRYINYSIVYAVLDLVGGVFYREFTKLNDYTAWNTLSVVQVLDLNVVSALISGIAGIGHIILGVSLVRILLDIKIR